MDERVLAILSNVVDWMEKNGSTHNTVSFAIDESLVNEIYEDSGRQYSITELETAADKCLAHEWIAHRSLGAKYSSLTITEKGLGIVRSKRKQESDRKNRKILKKISDYIEDHKGLFVFLGLAVAVATLIIKLLTDK